MTDKQNHLRYSLRRKAAVSVILAVIAGLIIALVTNSLSNYLADKYIFTEEKRQEYLLGMQTRLQDFVTENNVSSIDSEILNNWAEENNNISLFIYKENKLIHQTGHPPQHRRTYPEDEAAFVSDANTGNENKPQRGKPDFENMEQPHANAEDAISPMESLLLTQDSSYFKILFADGPAVACILDNAEETIRELNLLTALILSFFSFSVIIVAYNQKKVHDIVSLSRTVHRIGNGESDLPIPSHGQDEIALLAQEVDAMRCSVLEKIENEKKVLAAGHELVATMSHDIRTPLTTLMGYLDMLHEHRFEDRETEEKYIEACRAKAQQLKTLSDRLFNYFLVFGQPVAPMSPESIPAQLFLSQVLGEQNLFLIENGFCVEYTPYEGEDTLFLDAQEVYRVFDNVFSNISRYADRNAPVRVQVTAFVQGLCVKIENGISSEATHSESTGFGLKICERVLRESGGDFRYTIKENRFLAEISLPVEKADPAERRKKK